VSVKLNTNDKIWIIFITTTAKVIVVLASLFLLITLLTLSLSMDTYVTWLETYLSPDGNITKPEKVVLVTIYGAVWIVVFFFNHSVGFHQSVRNNLPWRRISIHARVLFIVSVLLMLNWAIFFGHPMYEEDDLFQNATAGLAFSAGVLFLCLLFYRIPGRQKSAYFMLGAAFLFFAMEEISWGQRIFEWNTPQMWKRLNIQRETNMHNLLNEYLFVPANFFMLLGLGMLYVNAKWLSTKDIKLGWPWLSFFTPRDEYYLLGYSFYFLSLGSLAIGTEIAEEIIALLGLVVALRHLKQPQLESR
jgi:cell division protein FtsL